MFPTKLHNNALLVVMEAPEPGEGTVTTEDFVEKYGLPQYSVARYAIRELAKARILRTDRGVRGGFRLARAAKNITALEVIEAVVGDLVARTVALPGHPVLGRPDRLLEVPGPLAEFPRGRHDPGPAS